MTISLVSRQRIRQRANFLCEYCHYDGSIQRARRLWIRGGWHPPAHDPQQLTD